MTKKIDEARLREWIRNYLGKLRNVAPESIELDRTLGDYGMDSVDAVLMAGELEDDFETEVDPASFLQYDSFEKLVVGISRD